MKRVFSTEVLPEVSPASWVLPANVGHYVSAVLRMGMGEKMVLFDAAGRACVAEIVSLKQGGVEVSVESWDSLVSSEAAPCPVALVMCLIKGRKLDWVVQKATELGVREIRLAISERTVVRPDEERVEGRVERWQRISGEAARQCGRLDVPTIHPPTGLIAALKALPAWANEKKLLLWENAPACSLKQVCSAEKAGEGCSLIVGPEGGFSEEELVAMASMDCVPVSLGPRTLRAETAPLAALSGIQLFWGDMG